MNSMTCNASPIYCAGAAFSVFATSFVATASNYGHEHCVHVRSTQQNVATCHAADTADAACSALNTITARDIAEGEREVREGRWIGVAELRRELRSQAC